MALRINEAVDGVVARLRAAGLRATDDISKVDLPGAFVYASSVSHEYLNGAGAVTVTILLIAPDSGMHNATAILSGLLDDALTVIDPDADTQLAEQIQLPSGGPPLPAFRVSVDVPTQ